MADSFSTLFAMARDWLAAGHMAALATVVQTWGSAPRPAGSHLLIRDDGLFEGSVSGGCVEGDVITNALDLLAGSSPASKLLDYGVSNSRAWEVGLACGGKISILVQPVTEGFFDSLLMDEIISRTAAHEAVAVLSDLKSGNSRIVSPDIMAGPDQFRQTYEPDRRIAIIGAVHITQYLAPMAAQLGFSPLVIDPRGLFGRDERFPDVTMTDQWPDDALSAWKPDRSSAVVTLTHDPKLDDPALEVALRSEAFYIAALGSRKTHAARLERLQAKGFGPSDMERICGPAGLSIGAKSPAEIAIAVLAQMVARYRGATL